MRCSQLDAVAMADSLAPSQSSMQVMCDSQRRQARGRVRGVHAVHTPGVISVPPPLLSVQSMDRILDEDDNANR